MATRSILIPFIIMLATVSLSLSLSSTETNSSHQIIHIHVELGNNTLPVFLNCMVESHAIVKDKELHSGDDYSMKIRHKGIYSCNAVWSSYWAQFDAFNLGRDAGHTSLVWLIGQEGILLNWDDEPEFTLISPWMMG